MGSACTKKRNNPEENLPDIVERSTTGGTERCGGPMSHQESVITSNGYGGRFEEV